MTPKQILFLCGMVLALVVPLLSQLSRGGGARDRIPAVEGRERASADISGRIAAGVHWPEISEYGAVAAAGFQYAVVSLSASRPSEWQTALNAASGVGLYLIPGLWPPPYTQRADKSWSISSNGIRFLQLLRNNPQFVMGLFVFNEPYFTNPYTGAPAFECGYFSAEDLRGLRREIQKIWPEAKIFHDLGEASDWAPGGKAWRRNPGCIANKYADQREIVDLAGIWFYPFERGGVYRRAEGIAYLRSEIHFVRNSMYPAEPVLLGQSFSDPDAGLRYPTAAELRDWNCALRSLGAPLLSWYVWRQDIYPDVLVSHPETWVAAADRACR